MSALVEPCCDTPEIELREYSNPAVRVVHTQCNNCGALTVTSIRYKPAAAPEVIAVNDTQRKDPNK